MLTWLRNKFYIPAILQANTDIANKAWAMNQKLDELRRQIEEHNQALTRLIIHFNATEGLNYDSPLVRAASDKIAEDTIARLKAEAKASKMTEEGNA